MNTNTNRNIRALEIVTVNTEVNNPTGVNSNLSANAGI